MSDPRDDIFAVAAMLTELDRVLHPLERGEGGSFKVDPPLPPPLPTPTSQGRGGEGGRSAKAAPLASAPRSALPSAPRNAMPKRVPATVHPVQARAPSPAVLPERTRRRVTRPESMTARMPEARETRRETTDARGVKREPARGPLPVDGDSDESREATGAHPPRHRDRGQSLSTPTQTPPNPTRPDTRTVEAPPSMAERAEVPPHRRKTRVPRPPVEGLEREPARRLVRARVPEEATRRHRVPSSVSREPLASPVEPGPSPAPVPRQRRRHPVLSSDQPPVPGTRSIPLLPNAPRRGDRPSRPPEKASRPPTQSKRETLEAPRNPDRRAGHPSPGPVHIEVNTLVPSALRAEAPPRETVFDEEPLWVEVPESVSDTGARAFFVNGRRVTREDHETLQQAEQRLRRRMTGRSLWRRRG